jgi:hypothetical protein
MAKWINKTRAVPAETLQEASLTPQQRQLLAAVDFSNSSGDAWGAIGKEGVLRYMQDSLKRGYGTNNLSDFRYIEAPNVPGGYMLDWEGRQAPVADFKQLLKAGGRSIGWVGGSPAGDSSDGSAMTLANPSEGLNFGATWEGKGGTTFGFYRKPDGSVGIRTGSAQSNETGDIIAMASILAGGYFAGTAGAAGQAAGSAAGSAAGTAAAEGAATAGMVDLGGGLAMTADGAITGTTMAGGAGMSGAAVDGVISGATLGGYTGPTSFGVIDPEIAARYGLNSGVGFNNGGMSFGVLDQGIAANARNIAAGAGGMVPAGGAGGGGGGTTGGGAVEGGKSVIDKLGSLTTGNKLGDMVLSSAASSALGKLIASDAPEMPALTERKPESITKAVSEMPDPLAQQRARRRSLTEQLGRRGRASTIMTRPSGRLGG